MLAYNFQVARSNTNNACDKDEGQLKITCRLIKIEATPLWKIADRDSQNMAESKLNSRNPISKDEA